MQNRLLMGIMMRYAVRVAFLVWVVITGLFVLPMTYWALFMIIPGLYGILLWEGIKADRFLDESFRDFPYEEFFSVAGEKGKFRIRNREFRSYCEIISKIATRPEEIALERNEILFREGETVIARAEFRNGCEMMQFYRRFIGKFSQPYMAMRGMVRR